MAKVLGLRQQRVQFFYDTDFKTQGATTSTSRDFCVPEKILFATVSGQGDLSRTNLVTPGQLSSDQTVEQVHHLTPRVSVLPNVV